jgi:molybdopterin-guanine dinucleotide biosynthesis protein A
MTYEGTAGSGITVGVVLAGGLARRLGGGDKPLRMLAGATLLDHALARIRPQVSAIVLNANGDPSRFAAWDLPVVPDPVADTPGPLAGVLAGMLWARAHRPGAEDVLSVPSDTPFLPRDLLARLSAARADGAAIACAASGGRSHPVVGLWPVRLADALARALADGERKVETWAARHGLAVAAFDAGPPDPFFNVNTQEDLHEAARLLAELNRTPASPNA